MPQSHETAEGLRFDEFAAGYAAADCPVRTQVRDEVLRIVTERRPSFVLDVGCGTGQLLIELSPHIERGLGVDVSRKMLAGARRGAEVAGCPNLQFDFGSFLDCVESPPPWLNEARPDVITATYALHHLPTADKRRVLAGLSALLAGGGAIVIGDLMFSDDPQAHADRFAEAGYSTGHDRPETVDAMIEMCSRCGLRSHTAQLHPLAGVLVAERTS